MKSSWTTLFLSHFRPLKADTAHLSRCDTRVPVTVGPGYGMGCVNHFSAQGSLQTGRLRAEG